MMRTSTPVLFGWCCLLVLTAGLLPAPSTAQTFTDRDVAVVRRDDPRRTRLGTRIALLVGIDVYAHLPQLSYAEKDARDVARVLEACGFTVETMSLATATSAHQADSILTRVSQICRDVDPTDTVLIFLSGHGFSAGTRLPYFCAHHTDPANLEGTGLSLAEVQRRLETSPAAHRMLIVDACRNDPARGAAMATLDLPESFRSEALGILFSTGPGSRSYEPRDGAVDGDRHPIQNGIFTHFLLRGLEGDADTNGDGCVTFRELGYFTWEKTKAQTRLAQKPKLMWDGDAGGDILLRVLPEAVASSERRAEPVPVAPAPVVPAPRGCRVAPGAELRDGVWSAVVHEASGQKFLYVPPGAFQMGSPEGEADRDTDETQHRRRITRGFYLAETEVTVGQWRAFVAATEYRTDAERGVEVDGNQVGSYGLGADGKWAWQSEASWHKPFPGRKEYRPDENHPVVHVSWNDAQAYCRHHGLRLPSEAEWEYGARAGSTTAFPWGTKAEDGKGKANVADLTFARLLGREADGWPDFPFDDGHALLAPVGATAKNAWGFRDLIGNAWEWCEDAYGDYPASGADQAAASSGSMRVFRGGSWFDAPRYCRSADRGWGVPAGRVGNLGFRPALALSSDE